MRTYSESVAESRKINKAIDNHVEWWRWSLAFHKIGGYLWGRTTESVFRQSMRHGYALPH